MRVPIPSQHPGIRLLEQNQDRPELARVLEGYAGEFPLCQFSDPVRWRERSRTAASRFRRPDQQPRYYFPHLAARPWHLELPAARVLEQNFEAIRDEFRHVEHGIQAHPQKFLVEAGQWRTFTLFRNGDKWQENRALCPQTTRVIESLPNCTAGGGLAYFSIVEPGTRIKAHCGFTNARIRLHLGIEVPDGVRLTVAGETQSWSEGKCLAFDDSFMHAVHHDGQSRRVVLLLDCWHPDLSDAEIAFVAEVHRLFGAQSEQGRRQSAAPPEEYR